MNWEAVGALGELVGAIAVLLTLLYLARQVKQATSAIRLERKQKRLESWSHDARERSLNSSHSLEVYRIGNLDVEELSDEDSVIWTNYLISLLDAIMADYELYEERIFSKEDFEYLVIGELRRLTNNLPRIVHSWRKGLRESYPPKFQSFVDLQLEEYGV